MSILQARPAGGPANQSFASAGALAQAELAADLLNPQARISPKYFYDALGSKLFEAICQLDEYYLTRAEAAIFTTEAQAIADAAGTGSTLIDLGAGNCAKAAGLFPALQPRHYAPVDISAEFLHEAAAQLQAKFPEIAIHPLGLDFSQSLNLPAQLPRHQRLFFYPGSSIGNFTPLQAAQFLLQVRAACGPDGGLLIGVDLVKNPVVLEAAYDDALGVTAAFNLNALRHINTLLGADFDIRQWQHRALFNPSQSRIEMHLQARENLTVTWPGGQRGFAAGEGIHTENSYKYTQERFLEMLAQSGFGDMRCFTAPDQSYLVCHARAV